MKKEELEKQLINTLILAGDETITDETFERVKKKLVSHQNKIIKEVMIATLEDVLPEQATERNSAKLSDVEYFSYEQCIAWNLCRQKIINKLNSLKK